MISLNRVQLLALIIFCLTYAFIITERLHRLKAAMLGFSLVLLMQLVEQSEIFSFIDFNTIGLLLGMMILVGILKKTGLIQHIAAEAVSYSKGNAWILLVFLASLTAVVSALIDNVTTVLLVGPIALAVADVMEINPMPFIFAEIFSSNIGGTATLIGDPPNLLIGSAAGLTFNDFIINLGPPVALSMIVLFALLYFWYGDELRPKRDGEASRGDFPVPKKLHDPALTVKVLFVMALVLVGFILHGMLHFEAATIALAGATLALIVCPVDVEEILLDVDWVTILFFSMLFMLVGTLEHVGVIELFATKMFSLFGDHFRALTMILIWASGVASAVVDNVPYTAAVIPLVKHISQLGGYDPRPLWWALALGACLGGNGTLVGASANLVMAGVANKAGIKLDFKTFLARGMVLMSGTLAVSAAYVFWRYL